MTSREITTRAGLACACALALAAVAAGCGNTSSDRSVDTPFGFKLDVPTDGSNQEIVQATVKSLYDHIDLNPDLEKCVEDKLGGLSEDEINSLANDDDAARDKAAFDLSNKFFAECNKPGDDVVPPDPSADTLKVARYSIK